MASLNLVSLSQLPSTQHYSSLTAAQPWCVLKPIISRIILIPCFCSSSAPTSPLLSILDKPPLSEHRADFASLISFFQSTQKSHRVDEASPLEQAEMGVESPPADRNRASDASGRDSGLFLVDEKSILNEDEFSSAAAEGDVETSLSPSYAEENQAGVSSAGEFSDSVEEIEAPSREDSPRDITSSNTEELQLAMQYRRVPQAHWAALLRSLCENGGIDIAIKLLNWLRKYRLTVFYDELFSIIIDWLGRNDRFSDALSLADHLEVKGAQMYNALLGACWNNNKYSLLLEFLQKMRQDGFKPDIVNYTFATRACVEEKVESHVIVDLFEDILKDQIEIDEKLYNDLIFAVSSAGNADLGLRLLQDMRSARFVPSVGSYNAVMFALGKVGRMDEVERILEEMKSCGRVPKVRIYNTIIRGYARKGKLDRAEEVFQLMGRSDIVPNERTYSLLIDACAKAGKLEKAWALFNHMRAAGLQPTPFIYGRLMTAFKSAGQWQGAIKILRKMQEAGIPPNRHVYNITIDSFGKHKRVDKAVEAFKTMRVKGIQPDTVSWNSLIEGQFRAGEKDRALQLFSMMKAEGCPPNRRTYNIMLDRLGQLKCWDDLKNILQDMKGNRLVPDSVTYTTLVDVYGQSGRFQDAYECLEIMRAEAPQPEPSVYCALANAYARQGLCDQAVGVFKKMEADGIKTNLLMLNSVLNAFCVASKPEEALSVFNFIVESGMTPDLVTYTTLMKGYIKAEQFDKAVSVFERMIQAGVSPDRKAKDMRRFIDKYSQKSHRPQLT